MPQFFFRLPLLLIALAFPAMADELPGDITFTGKADQAHAFYLDIPGNLIFKATPDGFRIDSARNAQGIDHISLQTQPLRFSSLQDFQAGYGHSLDEILATERKFCFLTDSSQWHKANQSIEVMYWPNTKTKADYQQAYDFLANLPKAIGTLKIINAKREKNPNYDPEKDNRPEIVTEVEFSVTLRYRYAPADLEKLNCFRPEPK